LRGLPSIAGFIPYTVCPKWWQFSRCENFARAGAGETNNEEQTELIGILRPWFRSAKTTIFSGASSVQDVLGKQAAK
jgi:hypothetical protein